MNLGEAGITEERATFVSAIGGGDVAAAGIGRKEKNIAVTTGCQNNSVAREGLNFPSTKVAGDNPLGMSIDQNKIQHLGLWEHFHRAEGDLLAESLIGAEQK